MDLRKVLLTENDCYKTGKTITPTGVMWHSTGANNPYVCRYVAPDDGLLGKNQYNNHWNMGGLNVCVHAFIGKDKNGDIATYQTLPFNMRGWHAGGSANNSHISFEICEDNLTSKTYFDKVYKEAVEFTAYLCELYNLDPMGKNVIICHADGCKLGIASNHGDVYHWFKKYNKTMDDVRKDVKSVMEKSSKEEPKVETPDELYRVRKTWADAKSQVGAYKILANAKGAADKNPGYSVYNRSGECVYPIDDKAPEPEVYTVDSFSVGEIVNFAGGKHYAHANASSGGTVKASLAKITSKYPSGKHPLHLRAVNNDGEFIGGVYGWVDVETVTKRTVSVTKKTVDELAREVIAGKWGNGTDRKNALTNAGYDFAAVQKRVNELLK